MATRRFRPSFRRAPRRGFTRAITEPKKWEAANFFFQELFLAPSLAFDLVAWDLMSVAHFSGFGTDPRQLADAIKSVDIGGVVWDTQVFGINAGTGVLQSYNIIEVLATDRLTSSDLPACLPTLDWTLTASPVSGSSTGAVDGDFPVRIHKRRSFSGVANAATPSTTNAVLASGYPVLSNSWSTQRCRIKGALGDRQGLFLFQQLSSLSDASSINAQIHVAGTLYYRVRY